MNRRRLAAISIATVSLGAAFFTMRTLEGRARSHGPEMRAEARGGDTIAETNKKTSLETTVIDGREKNPFKDKPRSLRGTDVDGALRVGPDGSLVIGPEILRLFDHFFTTLGEESEEKIRERILAAIRERVSGPAALQASALLDQYLRYRKDAKDLRLSRDDEADPEKRLEAIKKLRRKTFGEEVGEKLFGDEEREGETAIAESKVRQDNTLSDEQKAEKLAALEEKLPESARAARDQSTLPLRAQAEVEAMRAEGATAEDVHAYRTETFGAEAADRMAALDEARAAWKARIEAFEKERAKLDASIDDDEAFRAAEQALLDKSFTPLEQRRVRATLAMQQK